MNAFLNRRDSTAIRSVWTKQALIAIWSIAWAAVMTLIQNWRGVQTFGDAITWVVFHVIGVMYLSRPLRTVGETLVLAGGGAMTFVVVRFAAFQITGADLYLPLGFGLSLLIGLVEYWLVLAGILLVGRWLFRRLSTMPYLGTCLHCDYDLRGNESGKCPECGESVHDDQRRYLRNLECESN